MSTSTSHLVFDVAGMDCGDCAKSIERTVAQLPDVNEAQVSFGSGTLTVDAASGASGDLSRTVQRTVDRAGYVATLRQEGGPGRVRRNPWWKNRRLIPTGIAIILWIAAFSLSQLIAQQDVVVGLYLLAIVIGGFPIARAAVQALRARRVDMNVLMTISVIGASIIGEWSEGALVVVLFTVGATLQALTLDRTRLALRSLFDITPEEATVLRDGVEVPARASTLTVGDVVRVRPGDRIPADGEIVSGASALNESAITGESLPVEKGESDTVYAGSMNGSGVLTVRVTSLPSESMLSRIVHLVEEAQASKAPSQQLVDRFASIYTPAVVVLAAVIALFGWLVLGDGEMWFYRALVLLVIACPCALVISTPVSIVSAIGAATRLGMLVKGGSALEEAGRSRAVVFDKTGTLTMGRPSVTGIVVAGIPSFSAGISERDLLSLAAAVEHGSEHPLARAVVARALHDEVPVPIATSFETLPGRGVRAVVNGRTTVIGNDRLMTEIGLSKDDLDTYGEGVVTAFANRGESVLVVAEERSNGPKILGMIAVADRVRPGAADAIQRLRDLGVEKIMMLTGDRSAVAWRIGDMVGVDDVRSGCLPHEKAEAIAQLQAEGWHVTHVGDGINDAPALATANVGIAMGMGGTDVALESADLALMRDDLSVVGSVVDLSRRTVSIIKQNITLSMVTKLIALVLGLFGVVNLWIAVLADVGTSVVVTLNGMRLTRAAAVSTPVRCPAPKAHACGCDGDDHDHADEDAPAVTSGQHV